MFRVACTLQRNRSVVIGSSSTCNALRTVVRENGSASNHHHHRGGGGDFLAKAKTALSTSPTVAAALGNAPGLIPIATGCFLGSLVAFCGDVAHQYATAKNLPENRRMQTFFMKKWHIQRTLHRCFFERVVLTPFRYFWYGHLVAHASTSAIVRVGADYFAASCLWPVYDWWFRTINDQYEQPPITKKVTEIELQNYWLPFQIVNFSCVARKYNVLFSNFVSTVWNVRTIECLTVEEGVNDAVFGNGKRDKWFWNTY